MKRFILNGILETAICGLAVAAGINSHAMNLDGNREWGAWSVCFALPILGCGVLFAVRDFCNGFCRLLDVSKTASPAMKIQGWIVTAATDYVRRGDTTALETVIKPAIERAKSNGQSN